MAEFRAVKAPACQIIYTHGGGRLGNQVLRFVHWIAWARAHAPEIEVVNVAFWPFAEHFALWRDHPGCVFPLRPSVADRVARGHARLPARWRLSLDEAQRLAHAIQAAGRWCPGWQAVELDIANEESLDLEAPGFLAQVRRRAVTTCSGWRIACWDLVARQEDELRGCFRPVPEIERLATEFITEVRRRHDIVIGVLIRQSDYGVWQDGRFHFETARYAAWLRELRDLHPGRRVAFVVASEAWQPPAAFEGLTVFFATGTLNAGGQAFESWVELSLCDCIVSPPSTFSATAAFRGNVPLWPVTDSGQTMAPEQRIDGGLAAAARHPIFSRAVK